jgi:hypothetical protein
MKVTARGSSAADVELRNATVAVMIKMKEADTNLLVLPYSNDDSALKPLMGVKDIPETVSKLKKYSRMQLPG